MERPQEVAPSSPPRLPWLVAGLGGVAAVVGCLLPWLVADFGRISILVQSSTRTISSNAWDTDVYGRIAVAGGVGLLVAALVIGFGAPRLRRAFGLIAVIAGAVVTSVAIFEMVTKGARVDHVIREAFGSGAGRTLDDLEFTRLKDVLARLGFSVSLGFGVFLAALGGVAGIVGGAMAAVERRAPASRTGGFDAAPTPPPAADTEPPAAPGVDTLPG